MSHILVCHYADHYFWSIKPSYKALTVMLGWAIPGWTLSGPLRHYSRDKITGSGHPPLHLKFHPPNSIMTLLAGSVSGSLCTPWIRVHVDILTFLSYVLPPVVGYFVLAALAVTPRTHGLRIALWPLVTLLALRAGVSVDMSSDKPGRHFYNTLFVFCMISVVTRTFDWTLTRNPLMRLSRPNNEHRSIMIDTLDLALTLRGYGWDWSRGVYIPRETRPTNRGGFLSHTILSAAAHALTCGVFHMAIRLHAPVQVGTLSGGSIFDDALPFYMRYARASITSAFAAFAIYAFLQTCYDVCTVVGVLVLGQDPTQWPPAFDSPLYATSLGDFWGRRWHQFFRRMFLVQGGYPLSFFLGRTGIVIGAFLSSGVMHHIAMVSLNGKVTPWRMVAGFGMMAPGILAERAFKRWTGRKVGGVVGWLWTVAWLALWGNLIIDATVRAGAYGGHLGFTERVIPSREVMEGVMVDIFCLSK